MKSLIASIAILGIVGMVVGVAVLAGTEAGITATVTPGVVSVEVDVPSFDYGYVSLNSSETSPTITATVGDVNTDLTIKGDDATSDTGTWALKGTPGSDEYVHKTGLGDPDAGAISYPITLTKEAQNLVTVTASGTEKFGLEISTPVSSTVLEEYTVPVTVMAAAH